MPTLTLTWLSDSFAGVLNLLGVRHRHRCVFVHLHRQLRHSKVSFPRRNGLDSPPQKVVATQEPVVAEADVKGATLKYPRELQCRQINYLPSPVESQFASTPFPNIKACPTKLGLRKGD
jgi:hypothetical protein